MANEWRPVIAALANPEMREVVALLILGQDAESFLSERSPSRRRHIVEGLRTAGLVDHGMRLRDEVFGELLRASAPVRPTGVERFLRDGRIDRYPSSAADRAELLAYVVERTLRADEVLTERDFTERLASLSDNPAALRRYLVDAGLVERRRDGSEYARAQSAA